VLETAHQVASVPVSTNLVPYEQVRGQCEALVTGKQQKMSALLSFKHQQESTAIVAADDYEKNSTAIVPMVRSSIFPTSDNSPPATPQKKDKLKIRRKKTWSDISECISVVGTACLSIFPSGPARLKVCSTVFE